MVRRRVGLQSVMKICPKASSATSEVYVADAIDYVQHGVVYRFTPQGRALDTLRVGIVPGSFCFKP